jgi:hypothetical protein
MRTADGIVQAGAGAKARITDAKFEVGGDRSFSDPVWN